MKELADRLKMIQEQKGMTQAELAAHLGISLSALSGYMRDRKSPNISDAAKMAKKLGVSIGWLCGEDDRSKIGKLFSDNSDYAQVVEVIEQLLRLAKPYFTVGFFNLSGNGAITDETHAGIVTRDSSIMEYFETLKKASEMINENFADGGRYIDIVEEKKKQLKAIPVVMDTIPF